MIAHTLTGKAYTCLNCSGLRHFDHNQTGTRSYGGHLKLSTRSRYGTRILLELARQTDGNPVQVGTISRHQDISVKYLEQLIRTLKKAGLVKSVRGAKGGHILARAPEAISLGAIVRLFEEQHELVRCISSPDICQMADECRVRLAWKEATEALYERLDAITIADLLCEPSPPAIKISSLKARKA